MTYLLFASALGLSACAAYYSVMGLVAIFAASVVPIFIMGTLLEASKLVVASWIYRNWKDIPLMMKSYFTIALVILMMLTSMGIFGYLSKAHLDQNIPSGDVAAKLALIDEKIKTEKENINASRKEITQLDQQVDQTIGRTTDDKGAERAIAIRKGQQKDRQRILKEISDSQTKLAGYNEERAPIASEVRKVEAEVGPIKYIAALIYGDNPESDVLEKAVRWVIIMIVSVFDPLAVLLLIAANWQQKRDSEDDSFKDKPNIIDEGILPEVEETPKIISMSVGDVVIVGEETDIKTSYEDKPVEETATEEDLDIKVDESKDWEASLYDRIDNRTEEISSNKAKSFLSKAKDVFTTGIKTIETEVEEIQKNK
jgi:flagellar basal body-associated protein FliL